MKLGIVLAVFGLAILTLSVELIQKEAKTAYAVEPPPCINSFEGLASWWPGDLDADDIQAYNAGILANGAKIASGFVRNGFSFDGKDDYVRVADSDSLDVSAGLTLNAWAYWEGFSESDLVSVIATKDGAFSLGIRNFGGPQLYAEVHQLGGHATFLTTGENFFPTDRWVYVSLVFGASDGEVVIYVDGTPFGAELLTERSALQASDADLFLGSDAGDSTFHGLIDEVELYGRALTRAEIESLIETRETGKCSGSLEVTVEVVPGWSDVVLDLLINGEVKADDLVGGGTTGEVRVPLGYQMITRTASDGYYLYGYATAFECRNDGDLIIRWWTGATLVELPVQNGESIVCAMTVYETGCDPAGYENVIIGDDGDNVLTGTEGKDVILGLGGDDIINGLEGNDCLIGGPGEDNVTGGGGNDEINDSIGNPPPPPPPVVVEPVLELLPEEPVE